MKRSFHSLPLAIGLGVLFLVACTVAPPRGEPAAVQNTAATADPLLTESLFDYKERTLSEADIRRILDSKIELRDSLRLAVFNFGSSMARYGAWRWYDEESLQSQQQLLDTLTYALTRSRRVQQVIFLPSMVTGAKPNIHQLRESAVRVQADMLLIFSLNSDIFQKYRAFKKDEAKAYATCEAVLMDIRTGVIPHTCVVTRRAQTAQIGGDYTSEEMQNRVLHAASLEALLETGTQTAAYLNGN
jgi:hypothetical protein